MRSRNRMRLLLSAALAAFFLVSAAASGQPRPERYRTLSGTDVPTYFVVLHFFSTIERRSESGEDGLQAYLSRFGIPSPSGVRDVLLEEASLANSIRAESDREDNLSLARLREDRAANRPPDPAAALQRHDRKRKVAEEIGKCYGRFLARLRAGGRYPDAFESIVQVELTKAMSLNFDDDPDAFVYIYSLDAAFRRGVNAELKEP